MKTTLAIACASVLLGCGSAGVALAPGMHETARRETLHGAASGAVRRAAPVDETVCPPIDFARLEPPPVVPDARTVALSDVFPKEQPRTSAAVPLQIDLGKVEFDRNGPSGDPSLSPIGMGWMGVSPESLGSEVASDVASTLQARHAALVELHQQNHRSDLLHERANLLHAMRPDGEGVDLRCTIQARADLERSITEQKAAARRASEHLIDLIGHAPSMTAAEKLLLGCLLVERDAQAPRGSNHPRASSPGEAAHPAATSTDHALALFEEVAADPKARAELRARAYQQSAPILLDSSDSARGLDALRHVLTLTKDSDLRIDTLVKLADLGSGHGSDAAAHEKLVLQVIAEIDHGAHSDLLAEKLSDLAKLRLERGAFEEARDAAIRCAREVAKDFSDDPDPWGCAPTLAEALAELGGAERGVDLPLPFLGPLSRSVMESALDRFDRDEATHAGELLLSRFPEAREAPEVVALLASTTSNLERKEALTTMRERDYGRGSTWHVTQRMRLAPHNELAQLDQALAWLVAPPSRSRTPPPTIDEAIQAERQERVGQVIGTCASELSHAKGRISLQIDTTLSRPSAHARGANKAITECLERVAATCFRSFAPAKITVELVPR